MPIGCADRDGVSADPSKPDSNASIVLHQDALKHCSPSRRSINRVTRALPVSTCALTLRVNGSLRCAQRSSIRKIARRDIRDRVVPSWRCLCRVPPCRISRPLEPLGSGGMGVVYQSRRHDARAHWAVALKFLPPQIAHDPKQVLRFREEARTASVLNHPNICTIYEVAEEQGELFIAMEFVEGRPLSESIREGGMPVIIKAISDTGGKSRGLGSTHTRGERFIVT